MYHTRFPSTQRWFIVSSVNRFQKSYFLCLCRNVLNEERFARLTRCGEKFVWPIFLTEM